MNSQFLYGIRVFVAMFLLGIYLLFSSLVYVGLDDPTVITIVRHAVLVSGLAPAICWISLLVSRKLHLKYCLSVLFITAFHVFVFAVSAHKDGVIYWGVQTLEIVVLFIILWRLYIANIIVWKTGS